MFGYLRNFEKFRNVSVNGCRPFNGLNLALSVVGGIALAVFCLGIFSGESEAAVLAGIVAASIFGLLLYRNRKMGDMQKMLSYSAVSIGLGALAFIALIASALGAGLRQMNGAGGMFGGAASNLFGAAGGSHKKSAQDEGFSKQDDLNAQMQGYANAQHYQDATGHSGHDIM